MHLEFPNMVYETEIKYSIRQNIQNRNLVEINLQNDGNVGKVVTLPADLSKENRFWKKVKSFLFLIFKLVLVIAQCRVQYDKYFPRPMCDNSFIISA